MTGFPRRRVLSGLGLTGAIGTLSVIFQNCESSRLSSVVNQASEVTNGPFQVSTEETHFNVRYFGAVGDGVADDTHNGVHNRDIFIERNELGNGQPFDICIQSLLNGRFIANRHIRNNNEIGSRGVVLGTAGTTIRNLLCEQEVFIVGDDNKSYCAYEFLPGASYEKIRIISPEWQQFDGSNHLRYSNPSVITKLEDS